MGYAEVFARPQRGVRWFYGGHNELEPGDENFYEEVAHFLSQDTALREAIIFLRVEAEKLTDLSELQVFPLPEQGCWVICHPSVKTLPLPDWNCYQAIVKALLAMPMPAEVAVTALVCIHAIRQNPV
jgi:hypothetical protein